VFALDVPQHAKQTMQMKWLEKHMNLASLQRSHHVAHSFIQSIAEDGDLPGLLVGGQVREALDKFPLAGTIGIDDNKVRPVRLKQFERLFGRCGRGDFMSKVIQQSKRRKGLGFTGMAVKDQCFYRQLFLSRHWRSPGLGIPELNFRTA
jgi:hypothetical protein